MRNKTGNIHYICENVVHTVHELGTIVNKRDLKQVKNKKSILGKLYACKSGAMLQFQLINKEHYYTYAS